MTPSVSFSAVLQRRVVVGDGLFALLAIDERVHRLADDGPRPDDGDLLRQLFQGARLRARQELYLGAALDLEDADGVAGADHVVDGGVGEVDAAEVDAVAAALGDDVDALFDEREHAQRQEVDLDHAGVVDGVLVPLADVAAGHAAPFDGHELGDGLGGDDHAADVLREVARHAVDLRRQRHEVAPEGSAGLVAELRQRRHLFRQVVGVPRVDALRQLVELRFRQAERFADVADGGAHLVADDLADEGRVVRAELVVDAQDERFADVAGEVEVDVRHGGAFFVEEAAEEEVVAQRVDVGEADEIADERADRGAASASRRQPGEASGRGAAHLRRLLARHLQQLPVDEEEAGEAALAHHAQLLAQAGVDLRRDAAVAFAGGLVADALQVGIDRLAFGHRVVGEGVAEVAREVEGAALGDADAVGEGLGPFGEERGHLVGRFQVVLGVLASKLVRGVERCAVADGDEHVLESMALAQVVVDVVGGDAADAESLRQRRQRLVALAVAVDEVVLQLDPEVLAAEGFDVASRRRFRLAQASGGDERRHFALLAAGEGDEAFAVAGERLEVERRLAALAEVWACVRRRQRLA